MKPDHPCWTRAVLSAVVGALILLIVQTLDGLTVEHVRILILGVALGLVLLGALEGTVIPAAVTVMRVIQRWRRYGR